MFVAAVVAAASAVKGCFTSSLSRIDLTLSWRMTTRKMISVVRLKVGPKSFITRTNTHTHTYIYT